MLLKDWAREGSVEFAPQPQPQAAYVMQVLACLRAELLQLLAMK